MLAAAAGRLERAEHKAARVVADWPGESAAIPLEFEVVSEEESVHAGYPSGHRNGAEE